MNGFPTITIDLVLDWTTKEGLHGVLHAILFHRLFGTVRPQTFEVLDVTMPGVADPEMERLVNEKVGLFWKAIEGGVNKRGQVIVIFAEKRPKKSWFQTYEEEIPWEQWVINVEYRQLKSEADRQVALSTLASTLTRTLQTMITHTSSEQGRNVVPQITNAEGISPFPVKIVKRSSIKIPLKGSALRALSSNYFLFLPQPASPAMSSSRRNDNAASPNIAIIGAGIGGLACAIALRRQLGYENFKIYEKAADIGGTWRDNIYPGCSSDVGMDFYSLSTDLHNWKESHGSQEDILEYWRELTVKYGLYSTISFNSLIKSLDWNDAESKYYITIEDPKTGLTRVETANIVVSAIGGLEVPRYPNIPGLETFKGVMFHSARWRKDVDLRGKRVGVIGNGASATQFVPRITENPSVQVTEFCKTPNWFLPPMRMTHSNFRRILVGYVPFMARLMRFIAFMRTELFYLTIFATPFIRRSYTKLAKDYIISTAPEEYHDVLVPTFPLGCKRVIFDTNFLSALHRPNLKLDWNGIQSITEDGIITKKGEKYAFDVLIFATGFAADLFSLPVNARSQSIQEYFEKEKGPKAYLGTVIPGFPNFFTIFGPNTATGHTSVIFTNEVQVQYILQVIKPILDRKVLALEVTRQATDAYNEKSKSDFRVQYSLSVFRGTGLAVTEESQAFSLERRLYFGGGFANQNGLTLQAPVWTSG
ncbi:hypothetical protein BDQ17DRAFT_1421862 [Cyathus striatus]|nr:hypothetical protein BDQ17DRAFT_1421862 [Cyathus striatus]